MFHCPPYNPITCGPIFRRGYLFQTLDPEPQHLSLTALFGKQDKATCQEAAGPPKTLHQQQQEKLPIRQGVVRSLSYEEPRRRSPPVDRQLCPAIQKLLVGSADLQPLAELPESWPCRDAARPGSPRGPEVSRRAHGAPRTQNAPDQLQSIPKAPAPAASAATLPPQTPGPRALPRPAPPGPGPGRQPPGPSEVSPRELLWKLQAVQQEQQLPAPGRPALAAKFPAATPRARARNPLESWRDQTPSAEQQAPLLQVGAAGWEVLGGRGVGGTFLCRPRASAPSAHRAPTFAACLEGDLALAQQSGSSSLQRGFIPTVKPSCDEV